jgi:predicted RNA-binding Zn-ribbon protein involved in translation (DUF1610 family)
MTRRVEIKTGLFGKRSVSYNCPTCSARLSSPERDIGANDTCPDCNAVFQVPGREEINRLNRTLAEVEWERKQAEERERREKEEAKERQRIERERQRANNEREPAPPKASQVVSSKPAASGTKKCPYCAEEILAEAAKCKHCGEFLTAELRRANTVAPAKSTGGGECGPVLTIAFGIIVAVIILALL